jgi:serine/threonine protein kinase
MRGETLGNYRMVAELGHGGMGVVYLAEHTLLGRKVAVKILRNDVAPELVERFFTEARAAASLQHPGLVDVFDFGHDERGSAYIVMEFLDGEDLAERLERDPRLPIPIACAITRSVANALQVAHEQGIVHRDPPGNIFLFPTTRRLPASHQGPRFGIAKLLREREPRSVKTHSGALIGTPGYMSPEQCKSAKSVDGRSDIYALGCILYEMLLGVAPFDYDNWGELVGAHIHEDPPCPTDLDPTLPPQISTLLMKMLQKKPEDRHRSMLELAQSLEVLLREQGVVPVRYTPTPAKRAHRATRGRYPTLAAVAPDSQNKSPSQSKNVPMAVDDTMAPQSAPIAVALPRAAHHGRDRTSRSPASSALRSPTSHSSRSDDATPESHIVIDDRRDLATPTPEPDAALPVAAEVDAGVGAKSVEPKKPPTQAALLERTFAKKKSELAACARAHPEGRGEKLTMRLQIDAEGKVLATELLLQRSRRRPSARA